MRRASPFGQVQPDDSPEAYCHECGNRYNPYRHGLNCPNCEHGESGEGS